MSWNFQREAVWREFRPTLRLAVPLVLAELSWMSMTTVDTIMVGRLPNAAVAIGAAALGGGLYYTIAIFGSGLMLGLDTLVSQAFGRDDLHDARHSLVNSIVMAVVLTPLLMAAVSLMPALMLRVGVKAEIVGTMAPFLQALNWSTLPLLLYSTLRRYLQAVNIVKPVTFALVSANVVNALFNWIFIYGHLGARAYGVPGSGWSTCVARAYMAGVLVFALFYDDRPRRLLLREHAWRVDLRRIQALLQLGGPAATQILLEIGGFTAAGAMAGKVGATALAAHQIALNCAAFTYMVPLGVSSAAAVRVGHALGRKDPAGARRAGWVSIFLGGAFMLMAGLVFVSIPRAIARIYTPDPTVIHAGANLLLIAAAFQLFDGIQTVTTGALRGAGETRTPMIANFIAYWIVGLPAGYALCFRANWGVIGLWIGLSIGLIQVAAIVLYSWWKRMHVERSLHPAAVSTQT
jgi:MATE family multidrug resistance protein